MKRLGYTRYVAQGGDWGAFVVDQMGVQAPPGLLAIHTNMPAMVPADVDEALLAGGPPPSGLSAEEGARTSSSSGRFKQVELCQDTWRPGRRPCTALRIRRWGSPPGCSTMTISTASRRRRSRRRSTGPSSATGELTRDEILDNITLYWLTNTGVSASRLYWEYKGGFFNAKGSTFRWR